MLALPQTKHIHFFRPGMSHEPAPEAVLGGKGRSLAAMSKAGLPVPPGFTLCVDCCRIYHTENRWPDGLENELRESLAWLEAETKCTFGKGPRPLLVAVRSGAAVSMPGMMDTVLNVGLHPELEAHFAGLDKRGFWAAYRDYIRQYGETICGIHSSVFDDAGVGSDIEQAKKCLEAFKKSAGREFPTDPWTMLKDAVVAVFNSWNSERAIRYRARNNVRSLHGTAVNVQAMYPCEVSGILFTQDPTKPEANRIIVETSPGLGEALVLGHVEPDKYQIDRGSMAIAEKTAAEKSGGSLKDELIIDVAKIGMKIENYFGFPVDIEWGYVDGKFALLQSRKIRGLDIANDAKVARNEEVERLKKLSAGKKKCVWAVHNLGETLRFPTPLTWDIVGGFMRNKNGFMGLYTDLGFRPSARVLKDGILELICGRIYADVECSGELFFDDYPLEYDLENPTLEALLGPPTKFNFERAGGGFLIKLPFHLLRMLFSSRIMKKAAKRNLIDFGLRVLPKLEAYVKAERAVDLSKLSDTDVLKQLATREVVLNDFGKESLKPGFLANYFHERLTRNLEMILGPEKAPQIIGKLLVGLEGDKTVESNIDLYQITRNNFTLEEFLLEYGHRTLNEFELQEPRWHEDPTYIKQMIESYKKPGAQSPVELHERQKRDRKQAEDSLSALLAENGGSSLEDEIRDDLKGTQAYMPYRETGKHYFMKVIDLVRRCLEELAQRWDLGKDFYFLHRDELAQFSTRREELLKEVSKRKIRWQSQQRIPVPEIIFSTELEAIGRAEELSASKDGVFKAIGVAAGLGTGTARIVHSPQEAPDLGADYVLVCPSTDPGWAPLFVNARGLIVERGGVLSHGAIVARDFGIPAVVLKNASKLIPNGATVKIDGNQGTVEIVKT